MSGESGEEGSDMVCALVMELTILLKRQLQMKSQESSGTYKAMNELKHYIDTHYQEDLSLSNLSKIFLSAARHHQQEFPPDMGEKYKPLY